MVTNSSDFLFHQAIANDERSYSNELFSQTSIPYLSKALTEPDLEKWRGMASRIELVKEEIEEMDLGDIPDEFSCELMGILMEDPVILPSGHKVDRSVITRHLLNSNTDPFSRQKMTEDQLVEDTKLKEKIALWKKEQICQLQEDKKKKELEGQVEAIEEPSPEQPSSTGN